MREGKQFYNKFLIIKSKYDVIEPHYMDESTVYKLHEIVYESYY